MKKIITILLVLSSFCSFAQGPIIEGTYLPVKGTAINEIWDTTSVIAVPFPGADTTWDYSSAFLNPLNPNKIETFDPIITPYSSYFPTATHASYLRAPFNDFTDSLYSYYIIDTSGLYMIGGKSIKSAPSTGTYAVNDTIVTISPPELYVPNNAAYGMHLINNSKYQTFGRIFGTPVKIKGNKVKDMYGEGYGTLKMPNGTVYTDVLLTKVIINTIDSVFDPTGTYLALNSNTRIEYSFLRNNTFGSSVLMYFSVNAANTSVNSAFYTLPADCGSISGRVFDSLNELNPVIKGEVYLYRENSNFAKNDILAKDSLDSNGNYRFDNIPYGEYRISVRPDISIYNYALTTYWSDTTNGNDALSVFTNSDSTWNSPIHLQYHTDSVGSGNISGSLDLNLSLGITESQNSGFANRASDPIPGVDIIVRKKPGGIAMRELKTSPFGEFSMSNLANGNYDLLVDIPGLHMTGTYNFTISGGTVVNCLNFASGKTAIHPLCPNSTVGIREQQINNDDLMSIFPNPYSSNTTIKVSILENSYMLLEVYNLLGEKVQTIDKGKKQAGFYSYNFSAKSLNYTSGIYIVKLTAGNKTSVLKIIEQ
ncbi:MAG: T9SS type A sorting domain-containing protein [Bacteroidota bacterium]